MTEFIKYPKTKRFNQAFMMITEKIDGTNAAINIKGGVIVSVQSRNRIIKPNTPENKQLDNFEFAAFVYDHAELFARLGDGVHYGEWYGQGIGRGYGMPIGEGPRRRFALFNAGRWTKEELDSRGIPAEVVPVLYRGGLNSKQSDYSAALLVSQGSQAVPGYMNPEGIITVIEGTPYKTVFENKRGPSPEQGEENVANNQAVSG